MSASAAGEIVFPSFDWPFILLDNLTGRTSSPHLRPPAHVSRLCLLRRQAQGISLALALLLHGLGVSGHTQIREVASEQATAWLKWLQDEVRTEGRRGEGAARVRLHRKESSCYHKFANGPPSSCLATRQSDFPNKGAETRCNIARNMSVAPCVHLWNCCAQYCTQCCKSRSEFYFSNIASNSCTVKPLRATLRATVAPRSRFAQHCEQRLHRAAASRNIARNGHLFHNAIKRPQSRPSCNPISHPDTSADFLSFLGLFRKQKKNNSSSSFSLRHFGLHWFGNRAIDIACVLRAMVHRVSTPLIIDCAQCCIMSAP